jgi:hypothetical protein
MAAKIHEKNTKTKTQTIEIFLIGLRPTLRFAIHI